MSDGYEFTLSGGVKEGTTFERQLPSTVVADNPGTDFEEFWHSLEIAASGSQDLTLDILNNARIIIVIGGEGITVTFGTTGVDEVPADPFLVASNETDGSGFDQITVANGSSQERRVTIIACAFGA